MCSQNHRSFIFIFALLLSFGLLGSSVEGQYFGRNKVQYKNFDFKVLQTEHFEIYYYPKEEEAVKIAARMAERWYQRHSLILGDTLRGKQPLILYASHPEFQQTNTVRGQLSEGVGGVTESIKRRIVLPFAGPLGATDHVIGHELAHAFQYDITATGGVGLSNFGGVGRLPLWFIEGMAEYLSVGPVDPHTAMWMREAAQKKLPTIAELNRPEFFPYRYGQSLLAYIGGRWGDKKLTELLRLAGRTGDIRRTIDSILVISPDSLSKDWHRAIHAAYDSLLQQTSKPKDYGRALITSESGGGDLNVSPVLSPDGKQLVFFSERDLFSIDLFLADATTGKVLRNLYRTETDPHLQSIGFITSAGSWDPTGKRFVFSAVRKGKPVLRIVRVERNETEREMAFPELGEIFNPAWSPDGRTIAFSGLLGGLTDLFLYDITTDSLNRLTKDPYADLQPAWSPDGSTIVFTTDRFTTNLSNLDIGNYTLAKMDIQSGAIDPLPSFEGAKNINPQWSPDGRSLYFLSDRNGITNIYKLDVTSGETFQITNLYAGVSGITALSPALSSALKSDRIVFSVFEDGKYNVYRVDSVSILSGKTLSPAFSDGNPSLLPPADQSKSTLASTLANPSFGLPPDTTVKVADYRASLSLDGIGQPSVAAGVDRFGTYLGGGVSLFWSDMLGNHNLATGLQIQSGGGSTDIAALVGYFNTARRWSWGAVAQQVPYITASFGAGLGTVAGVPAYFEEQVIHRQINREISGLLSYPFSPALRMEFLTGYRNISFRRELQTRAVSLRTGALLLDTKEDLPSMPALNLGLATSAVVYDNSLFGATSPVLGNRYRFEVSPTFGSLSFVDILADYRHYFMPLRPFTIATRLLHFGRYGRDSEDNRLSPLFIGYPGLVRGYEAGSFDVGECGTGIGGTCPAFDRLQGSKFLVGNLELRFPLLGVLGLGGGYYGFFPIEFGAFFDTGVAWRSNQKASFLGGDRKLVSSVGVALRVNLLGFAVGEVDLVRPLDRPNKGWIWQFHLTQGF